MITPRGRSSDRGIEEVLRLHGEKPPQRPEFGPAPDRSRKAYRDE